MTDTTFADLGLSPASLEAIQAKGFETPTEIQAKAIPMLLESNQDIIAQAQTGTGKTATFGLVFTDRLEAKGAKHPQAIVLAPTRELAIQISEELNSLRGSKNLKIVPIYGGQSWGMQRKHLQAGVDIVVGTPGRVMDHLEKGTLNLRSLKYFVLDEADEMLNMGFIDDIETILQHVNDDRQVLLFSATMPSRISNLAKKYMKNPISIKSQKDTIAKNSIDQIYFEVSNYNKFDALCRIIDMEEEFYGIVFCRTKIASDELSKKLNDRGYKTEAFHGDVTQDRRESILKNFKKKNTEVLIATDVAARGIDVNDLTHVINYNLPQNSESYVHRIGRTGRAGKSGKAITLITSSEYRQLRRFEQHAKADITKQIIPDAASMVELKKGKIMRDLEEIIKDKEAMKTFGDLAGEMFKGHKPQVVLAALLKLSFEDSLDVTTYDNLSSGGGGKNGRDRTPNKFGESRLFLTTGYKDGATPSKILQMIDKDFGVPGSKVGEIDIMQDFSFISVPFAEAEVILESFKAMKRAGKFAPVRVEVAAQKGGGGGSRGGERGYGGDRGGRRNGGGRKSFDGPRKPFKKNPFKKKTK